MADNKHPLTDGEKCCIALIFLIFILFAIYILHP